MVEASSSKKIVHPTKKTTEGAEASSSKKSAPPTNKATKMAKASSSKKVTEASSSKEMVEASPSKQIAPPTNKSKGGSSSKLKKLTIDDLRDEAMAKIPMAPAIPTPDQLKDFKYSSDIVQFIVKLYNRLKLRRRVGNNGVQGVDFPIVAALEQLPELITKPEDLEDIKKNKEDRLVFMKVVAGLELEAKLYGYDTTRLKKAIDSMVDDLTARKVYTECPVPSDDLLNIILPYAQKEEAARQDKAVKEEEKEKKAAKKKEENEKKAKEKEKKEKAKEEKEKAMQEKEKNGKGKKQAAKEGSGEKDDGKKVTQKRKRQIEDEATTESAVTDDEPQIRHPRKRQTKSAATANLDSTPTGSAPAKAPKAKNGGTSGGASTGGAKGGRGGKDQLQNLPEPVEGASKDG